VTIHDVIPLSYYRSALPRRNRWFYSWNLRRGLRADRLLTVSQSAKREIAHHTKVREASIDVVTSAVIFPPNEERPNLGGARVEGDYLLYAGSYEPRKNLLGMLDAYDRFRRAGGRHSLIAVTERSSGHEAEVHAALDSLGCRDVVRFVHDLPEVELRALYTHASAVVFPSLAEGLGLPAIQAAACGVPIVASDLPALRETVGDIAVFARPGDPESLFHALVQVTSETWRRSDTLELGRQIAARYSPDDCASDHARVYWSCHERRHALA
jgi:glycosyltransferase involved in cell wall biosynthesis